MPPAPAPAPNPDRAPRRLRAPAGLLVAVAVAVITAAGLWSLRPEPPAPAPDPTDEAGVAAPPPIHRVELRRGAPPKLLRAPADAPSPTSPAPAPPAVSASTPGAAAVGEAEPEPAEPLDLDDLDPAVRERLSHAALDHLHALTEACAREVHERQDLGAFVRLDARGVAAVDLQPIGAEAGPITVTDQALPQALVTCLDDALWAQDWAADAADAVGDGSELAFALTMRLEPE